MSYASAVEPSVYGVAKLARLDWKEVEVGVDVAVKLVQVDGMRFEDIGAKVWVKFEDVPPAPHYY